MVNQQEFDDMTEKVKDAIKSNKDFIAIFMQDTKKDELRFSIKYVSRFELETIKKMGKLI